MTPDASVGAVLSSRLSARRASLALAWCLVAVAAWPATAPADVSGGDESPAQAFGPLALGHTYNGAFASGDDIDYLSFAVSKPETLEVTVQNTTGVCNDPNQAGCPVYATLMDPSGAGQLGGDTSGAGTIATAGDTEVFSWSFAQPGTFYVLLESNGDLPAGSPSYAVTLNSSSGSTGTGSGPGGTVRPPAPVVRSLSVPPRQRGRRVAARIVLGQSVSSLRADLLIHAHARQVTVASRLARHLGAGAHRIVLGLPSAYVRQLARGHHLTSWVRITVLAAGGRRLMFTRRVVLTR